MTKKPEPLYRSAPQRHCPVCGHVSYSAAGIHPQCAVRQADAVRLERTKAGPKLPKPSATSDVRPWQKLCPKCRGIVHVRKKTCECGHVFVQRPAGSIAEHVH
jgi:hypothetical protein